MTHFSLSFGSPVPKHGEIFFNFREKKPLQKNIDGAGFIFRSSEHNYLQKVNIFFHFEEWLKWPTLSKNMTN